MLQLSNDSKTRFYKGQKNTHGLMPGLTGTCPCATTGEGGCWYVPKGNKLHVCYVDSCITRLPATRNMLQRNTDLLRNAGYEQKLAILRTTFKQFQDHEIKYAKKHNLPEYSTCFFRLHWAGDIFDNDYAQALSHAILEFPNITFWGYTRSLFAVRHLASLPNLSLYISLDVCNLKEGLKTCYEINKELKTQKVKFSYLDGVDTFAEKFEQIKHEFPDWHPNTVPCPADTGKITHEESCSKCRLCLHPDKAINIWFKKT